MPHISSNWTSFVLSTLGEENKLWVFPQLDQNILLLTLCSSPRVRGQFSHPYKTEGTIIALYVCNQARILSQSHKPDSHVRMRCVAWHRIRAGLSLLFRLHRNFRVVCCTRPFEQILLNLPQMRESNQRSWWCQTLHRCGDTHIMFRLTDTCTQHIKAAGSSNHLSTFIYFSISFLPSLTNIMYFAFLTFFLFLSFLCAILCICFLIPLLVFLYFCCFAFHVLLFFLSFSLSLPLLPSIFLPLFLCYFFIVVYFRLCLNFYFFFHSCFCIVLSSAFFGCHFLDQNLRRYRSPPKQKTWPFLIQVEAINLSWMVPPSALSFKCQALLLVLQL